MSFVFQFSHQLCDNLSVGLASESYITEIFVFDFGMVVNDPVMDDENFFILVKVGVTISLVDLSTSCPSGMSNSDSGVDGLFGELVDKSLNAIQTNRGVCFFRKLAKHLFDFGVVFCEGNNTGTVVASVFEQFDSIAQ